MKARPNRGARLEVARRLDLGPAAQALATWLLARPRLAALLLALVCLPAGYPRGMVHGVDASWSIALHLARIEGLRYGTDVVFTYGPLGFLGVATPFLGPSSALATAFLVLVCLWMLYLVAAAALRAFQWPLAIAATFLAARVLGRVTPFMPFEVLQLAVTFACLRLIVERRANPAIPLAVCGAIAGLLLLGKLNAGIFAAITVIVTAAAVGRPRWRSTVAAASGIVATGIVLWLATGQGPGDLIGYLAGAWELIRGYGEAMGAIVDRGRGVPIAAACLVVILLALATAASRQLPAGPRLGVLAIIGIFAYAFLKTGLIRLHIALLFAALCLLAFALLLPRRQWSTSGAVLLAMLASFALATQAPPATLLNPLPSARALAVQIGAAIRPWRWADLATASDRRILDGSGMSPEVVSLLEGSSVHVDPTQADVLVGVPGARWRPEPVFQSYSAYTPALDQRNADFLAGPDAPDRILRSRPPRQLSGTELPRAISLDGRFLWWESPKATREMVCRYTEAVVTSSWEVLDRGPDRCGSEQPVTTVTARVGEDVAVPAAAPGSMLFVRISPLPRSLREQVMAALYRDHFWHVLIDGVSYRLVPGTVGDGLLLSTPAGTGWSDPFGFGAPIRTLRIVGERGTPSTPVTFSFESVPLAAAAP